MANPTIGHIRCPMGDGCTGEVRQYARGKQKLYWVCEHGMITPNLGPGQEFVKKHMKPIEAEPNPAPKEEPQHQEHKPKPKGKNWLSALLEDDDE